MTEWIYKWADNGWMNARGVEVVNRDLIEVASDLDHRVKQLGTGGVRLKYEWFPREENEVADEKANEALDEQYRYDDGYSSDSGDDYY